MREIETFCGKPIDDMSREELVDAVKTLGRMLFEAQSANLAAHARDQARREGSRPLRVLVQDSDASFKSL